MLRRRPRHLSDLGRGSSFEIQCPCGSETFSVIDPSGLNRYPEFVTNSLKGGLMRLFPLPLLLAVSMAVADSATQTDWSGGPGVAGPVSDWGDSFLSGARVLWDSIPGQLLVDLDFERLVEGESDNVDHLASGDIDGDGDIDLLGSRYASISWWENADRCGTDWIEHPIPGVSGMNLTTADLDADSDLDILASTDNEVLWLENDGIGPGWTVHQIEDSMTRAVSPFPADVDGDGDIDVICANLTYNDGVVRWWENTDGSALTWEEHGFAAASRGYQSVRGDDMDGDGDCDILAAALYDGDMIWLENRDGLGTDWLRVTIDASFDSAMMIYTTDLDGDGDTDVIGTCDFTGTGISWWENLDGSGTSWTRRSVGEGLGLDFGAILDTADLDMDGDMDISACTTFPSSFCWLENADGQGTSWEAHILREMAGYADASSITDADFDGDGWTDAAGCSWNEDDIYWWSLAPAGSLTSSILHARYFNWWSYLLWSYDAPGQSYLGFQVRSSVDPGSMGAWSDTLWTPGSIYGLLEDGTDFFQYRAILVPDGSGTSPALKDVGVYWNVGIAGGDPLPSALELLPVTPNPCAGAPELVVGLPVDEALAVSVFDVAGRLVVTSETPGRQGWQSIGLPGLTPGVYLVVVRAGGEEAVGRFTVISSGR